jgi:HEAT repeat protein
MSVDAASAQPDSSPPESPGDSGSFTDSAPEGTTPAAEGTTPVAEGTTPVAEGTTPVAEGTTPVAEGTTPAGEGRTIDEIYLEFSYIPEFLFEDLQFWFVPSLEAPKAVYHELVGESSKNWTAYYTKKGWNFIHETGGREGPFRVPKEGVHFDVLTPGKIFAPKPQVRLSKDGAPIPLLSLEKHKPINPWKPNYVQALNFIKKYDWQHSLPRRVTLAIWEIEECGQVAGSRSWINAERVLLASDSKEVRETLSDFFFNRPEDYELGSQVYLRVLGKLGREGFKELTDQAKHPITRKRAHVARTLGELRDERGVATLLLLADDEDFGVRDQALKSLVRLGVNESNDPEGKIAAFLESEEISHQVWAAAALFQGGDDSHRKYLVRLVKEDHRPLSELGELGEIILDLELFDTFPFLVKRFKSGPEDVAIDAAETLAQITGLEFDYGMVDDPTQKRTALRTLDRWWEDRKRERREDKKKGRSGS